MDDMNEHDESPDRPTEATDPSAPTGTAVDDAPPTDDAGPSDDAPPTDDAGPTDQPPPASDVPPTGTPPGPGATGWPGPGSPPRSGVDGLVRDPYSSFGGVLSGLAHRYAWSVAAVRLAFVALLLVSFGTAFLLYLAAWVIVPRATHWPPTPVRRRGEGLNNRDLGLAVAAVGLVTFLAIGTDGAASVLVPLVLVGAGIWLLLQHQREPVAAAPTVDPTGAPIPAFATPLLVGSPVPPRRRRSWVLRIFLGLVITAVIAALLIAAAVFAFFQGTGDGFNLTFGDDALVVANYEPDDLSGLPATIDAEVGAIRIDLTEIPIAQFGDLGEPYALDIDLGDGVVDLTLPDDLAFSVDARVGDGSLDLDLDNGLDADRLAGADIASGSLVYSDSNPDLVVTIVVGDGDINLNVES